jgi:prepilin-type processing-associated H-X9-DG protein
MAEAERLVATDPVAAANFARLRGLLAGLSADAKIDPPEGLAVSALCAISRHIVDNKLPLEGPSLAEPAKCAQFASDFHPVLGETQPLEESFEELPSVPVRAAYPVRRWFEVAIVAGIAFVTLGLITTGMMKLRREGQVASCKGNMMNLYNCLSGYADTHHDQFPKVGTPAAPNAGSFVGELKVACQLMSDAKAACPTDRPTTGDLSRVSYVYTLGYLSNGEVQGIRRRVQELSDELTPLLADLPTPGASPTDGPLSPHGKGQNILFADGHVKFSTYATVGPNGDDIYKNQNGRVRAGLHPLDASLGRATDVP